MFAGAVWGRSVGACFVGSCLFGVEVVSAWFVVAVFAVSVLGWYVVVLLLDSGFVGAWSV